MLSIQQLSKTYPASGVKALDRFSLDLSSGVYGLLGPNGAGKSTLMKMITGNLEQDSGQILYMGTDIRKLGSSFRAKLGYVPQQQTLYPDFTADRFLWYMAALKGIRRKEAREKIPDLLELVGLQNSANKKISSFSGGMKQRLLIAQALLNDPKLLILDEPTAGLDPKERIRIRNFISTIAQDKVVLLATHVVSDVESIAKEIVLLKKGRLLMHGSLSSLLDQMKDQVFQIAVSPGQLESFTQNRLVSNVAPNGDGSLTVRFLLGEGQEIPEAAEPAYPDLEELYLWHFGNEE